MKRNPLISPRCAWCLTKLSYSDKRYDQYGNMCKECDLRVTQAYNGYITQDQADEELKIQREINIEYYGEHKRKRLTANRKGIITEASSAF